MTKPPASEQRPEFRTFGCCEECWFCCPGCSSRCLHIAPPEQLAPTFAELEAILDPLYDGAADKRRLLRDVRGWLANHCLDCGEFIGDKPWRCKCTCARGECASMILSALWWLAVLFLLVCGL